MISLGKHVLPVLAAAGLLLALKTVAEGQRVEPLTPPYVAPAQNPFSAGVAGAGIIEARGENIAVGSPLSGIVAEVAVAVGERVEKGAPLFRLDDRAQRAEAGLKRAAVAAAEKKLGRLRALPRPETLPTARARAAEARSLRDDLKDQLTRWESIEDRRAVSADDLARRRFAVDAAERRLERAEAELKELEAGAWEADVLVTEAELAQTRADLVRAETEVERLTVRAPSTGHILQANVRPGEFVTAGPAGASGPAILLGDLDVLHIRVDIDEGDAPLFVPGAKAFATLKGRPDVRLPLRFVRVEPFVVPKKSLTGLAAERVDTRVLQVIYALEEKPPVPVYVGQQVDAFVEAGKGGKP